MVPILIKTLWDLHDQKNQDYDMLFFLLKLINIENLAKSKIKIV